MATEEYFSLETELEKIIYQLSIAKGKDCVIVDIDEIHSFRFELELIDLLTQTCKMRGIVICVSRPAIYLQRALVHRNLTTDELYFIDTIKCVSGAMDEEEIAKWMKNTSVLGSPFDIKAIISAVKARAESIKDKEHFVILDSVVPIVLYWDESKVEEFIKLLKNLPREYGTNVIIGVPKTCKGVR